MISNAELSNLELSNLELSKAELSNFELSNSKLSNAELSNAELSKAEVKQIREALEYAKNPFFFFHKDCDGLVSFLLLYKEKFQGDFLAVEDLPLKAKLAEKAKDSDVIFILDIATVEEDFFKDVKVPVYWIDHHMPIAIENEIKYFNPRLKDPRSYIPTSYLCWQIYKKNDWISFIGCVADYQLPDFANKIFENFPDLLPKEKIIEKIIYESKFGELIRCFNFVLKGKSKEIKRAISALIKIKTPYEIIENKTEEAKTINKICKKYYFEYEKIKAQAFQLAEKGKPFVFKYKSKFSFSSELANETIYRFKNPLVIICREKEQAYSCSLRTNLDIDLNKVLQMALVGTRGKGGGHERACGAQVPIESFELFLKNLFSELKI